MATATYDVGQYDIDTYGAATTLAPTSIDYEDVATAVALFLDTAVLVPETIPDDSDIIAAPLLPHPVLIPTAIDSVGDVTEVGLALLEAPPDTLIPTSIVEADDVAAPGFAAGTVLIPTAIETVGDVTAVGVVLLPLPLPPDTTYTTAVVATRIFATVTYEPRLFGGGTP